MDDIFEISNLSKPKGRKNGPMNKKIRVRPNTGTVSFDRSYIESLGIHLEENSDLTFAVNMKASPLVFVFNLNVDVLKSGNYYLSKAPKKTYSSSISDKDLATKLFISMFDKKGEVAKPVKPYYDFRLEFIANHSEMKFFSLYLDEG